MTIIKNNIVKKFIEYETPTHKIKFDKNKLNDIITTGKVDKLKSLIQKNIKQIVGNSNGEFWQESVDEIYNEIINDFNNGDFSDNE